MRDRGMIKWQPFDSLINSKQVINDILQAKKKINKPILSLDQQNYLNTLLLESFYNQSKVIIKYFFENNVNTITGTISHIDQNKKLIVVNDIKNLHISQILQIKY